MILAFLLPLLKSLGGVGLRLMRSPTAWIVLLVICLAGFGYYKWTSVNSTLDKVTQESTRLKTELGKANTAITSMTSDLTGIKGRLDAAADGRQNLDALIINTEKRMSSMRSRFQAELVDAEKKGKATEVANREYQRRLRCIESVTASRTQSKLTEVLKVCQ